MAASRDNFNNINVNSAGKKIKKFTSEKAKLIKKSFITIGKGLRDNSDKTSIKVDFRSFTITITSVTGVKFGSKVVSEISGSNIDLAKQINRLILNDVRNTINTSGFPNIDRSNASSKIKITQIFSNRFMTSSFSTKEEKTLKDLITIKNKFTSRMKGKSLGYLDLDLLIKSSLFELDKRNSSLAKNLLVKDIATNLSNLFFNSPSQNTFTRALINIGKQHSSKQRVLNSTAASFVGKKDRRYRKFNSTSKSSSVKKSSNKLDLQLSSKIKGKKISPSINIRGNSQPDLLDLQSLINSIIQETVAVNMADPSDSPDGALRFQSGRFAESTQVTSVSSTRSGAIDIAYTYQRYPYDTFAPWGKLYTAERNPKDLLDRSIRSIATGILGNRFNIRTNLV